MITFLLKQEHINLLKNASIMWYNDEYGAPCIDPKRPYGNSNVSLDIAEILGWDIVNGEPSEEQKIAAYLLHHETHFALSIILDHIGEDLKLGEYKKKSKYDERWEFVK